MCKNFHDNSRKNLSTSAPTTPCNSMSSSSDKADAATASSCSEDDKESDKLADLEQEKQRANVQKNPKQRG